MDLDFDKYKAQQFETVAGILRLWWTGRTFPFILPVQPFSEEGQL